MDKREELGACLTKMNGWGGLTVDLLAPAFISEEAARRAFSTLSTKARQNVSGKGLVVVCGMLAHKIPTVNVAGIICPVWDTETNLRWFGDTTVEGLKGGPILKLGDQNPEQFGWPSSPLAVYDFVVIQPASASATPVPRAATNVPAKQGPLKIEDRRTIQPVCSLCGRRLTVQDVYSRYDQIVGAAPRMYDGVVCKKCGSIICATCQGTPVNKPCSRCGGEVSPGFEDVLQATCVLSQNQLPASSPRSPIGQINLKCSGCGEKYCIGVDSVVVVLEVMAKFDPKLAANLRDMAARLEDMRAFNAKLGLRGKELSLSKGGTRGVPDHVRHIEPGANWSCREDHEQALAYVLNARKGFLKPTRYWKCEPCGKVQRYAHF